MSLSRSKEDNKSRPFIGPYKFHLLWSSHFIPVLIWHRYFLSHVYSSKNCSEFEFICTHKVLHVKPFFVWLISFKNSGFVRVLVSLRIKSMTSFFSLIYNLNLMGRDAMWLQKLHYVEIKVEALIFWVWERVS